MCHCGKVVKELLERANKLKPGSTPGDAVFCFFAPFFLFCLVSFLTACTRINIYFKLKSRVIFWKRDFKSF